MGETRVDLLHLLEDLRDAYPGSLEETILTEIIANSFDSGAATIRVEADPVGSALTVIDDGAGMRRRDLARYHDIASSGKTRGQGIGFAGVGIKLGLLASAEVVTETRRGATHVATTWNLASRRRAPWRWVPRPGLVAERGTAVRLRLENPLSALLDPGFIEAVVRRHFEPLLDPRFRDILAGHYPNGIRIAVNGRTLSGFEPLPGWAPVAIRISRQRKPSAQGYLERRDVPLPEDLRGIALSTFGKVIKRGWDWLGLSPSGADQVTGLIEAPALAESLTLSKADFVRTGPRGATYLTYRKAIQEAVSAQLAEWGNSVEAPAESRRRHTRPLERDLESVLVDLARKFPLLASLVNHRPGGQKRLPLGGAAAGSCEAHGSGSGREPGGDAGAEYSDGNRGGRAGGRTTTSCRAGARGCVESAPRRARPAPSRPPRSHDPVRAPAGRSRAQPVGGVHCLGQRSASRLRSGAGVEVRGVSPGAVGRDGARAARGGCGGGARVRDRVSGAVGSGGGAVEAAGERQRQVSQRGRRRRFANQDAGRDPQPVLEPPTAQRLASQASTRVTRTSSASPSGVSGPASMSRSTVASARS